MKNARCGPSYGCKDLEVNGHLWQLSVEVDAAACIVFPKLRGWDYSFVR